LEKALTSLELEVPKKSESEICKLIFEDALAAESGLPETAGTETVRASKWAAKCVWLMYIPQSGLCSEIYNQYGQTKYLIFKFIPINQLVKRIQGR
jgi:hypothetical protein